jgi:hypothetical protein
MVETMELEVELEVELEMEGTKKPSLHQGDWAGCPSRKLTTGSLGRGWFRFRLHDSILTQI